MPRKNQCCSKTGKGRRCTKNKDGEGEYCYIHNKTHEKTLVGAGVGLLAGAAITGTPGGALLGGGAGAVIGSVL